jgi:membrane dipeptidase
VTHPPYDQLGERAAHHRSGTLMIDPVTGHMVNPEPPAIDGKTYLDRIFDSGLNAVGVTLAAHVDDFSTFVEVAYHYLNLISAHPERLLQVEHVDDIRAAAEQRKLGVIFGAQTGGMIGTEIWKWTIAHKLGLRICALTYNERNPLGDGCLEPNDQGLTSFGRQGVQEMNRLGITLDISHVGPRTAMDALEFTSKPPIASHSNAQARTPSRRNLSREMMEIIAQKNGVMGLSGSSAMTYRETGVRPTLSDFLDMLDHCVQEIGVDHVGIGSDIFESYTKVSWESTTKRMYPQPWMYETRFADGMSHISDWPWAIQGLVDRGYTDDQIAQLVGGNWLRVFQDTWATGVGDVPPSAIGWQGQSDHYGAPHESSRG